MLLGADGAGDCENEVGTSELLTVEGPSDKVLGAAVGETLPAGD